MLYNQQYKSIRKLIIFTKSQKCHFPLQIKSLTNKVLANEIISQEDLDMLKYKLELCLENVSVTDPNLQSILQSNFKPFQEEGDAVHTPNVPDVLQDTQHNQKQHGNIVNADTQTAVTTPSQSHVMGHNTSSTVPQLSMQTLTTSHSSQASQQPATIQSQQHHNPVPTIGQQQAQSQTSYSVPPQVPSYIHRDSNQPSSHSKHLFTFKKTQQDTSTKQPHFQFVSI